MDIRSRVTELNTIMEKKILELNSIKENFYSELKNNIGKDCLIESVAQEINKFEKVAQEIEPILAMIVRNYETAMSIVEFYQNIITLRESSPKTIKKFLQYSKAIKEMN